MKAIFCLPLFFAAGLMADEAADRGAIVKVIVAVNDPGKRPGILASDLDSDVDFERLIDLHLGPSHGLPVLIGMDEPWRELTVPEVVCGGIRLITPTVAIVNGSSTIPGAVTLAQRVPLLFVLVREGTEWRITVVRRLATSAAGSYLMLSPTEQVTIRAKRP